MGTRHLFWILIGPSFAVYLKTSKTAEGQGTLFVMDNCHFKIIYSYTEHTEQMGTKNGNPGIMFLCHFYVMLIVKGWAPTPAEFSVYKKYCTVQCNKHAPFLNS